MRDYILIHRYGNREEVPFLVRGGQDYISAHISRREFGQRDGSQKVVIFDPLIELFEAVRKEAGPINISSGYRSDEYQRRLYEADLRMHGGRPSGNVAKPGSSPHETGAKSVREKLWGGAWDLFKLAIPAGMGAIGALLATMKGGKS